MNKQINKFGHLFSCIQLLTGLASDHHMFQEDEERACHFCSNLDERLRSLKVTNSW